MSDPVVVDAGVLAVVCGISERQVRYLVQIDVLVPLPKRKALGRMGRPRLMFDLDDAEKRVQEWRVA